MTFLRIETYWLPGVACLPFQTFDDWITELVHVSAFMLVVHLKDVIHKAVRPSLEKTGARLGRRIATTS